MALIQDELKIIPIKELLTMNLTLPSYQRPYSWSVKSTNTLFIDTFEAFKDGINENETQKILNALLKYKDKVKSFDIVEFNPKKDIDKKTEKITKDILIKIIDEFK